MNNSTKKSDLNKKELKLNNKTSKQIDFFIFAPLKSAKNLVEKLYDGDQFYETATYAWVGAEDAKKLFLFGVCKEVTKAMVSLIENKDFIKSVPSSPEMFLMEKNIIGSIIDSQNYKIRQAIEILSLLINFYKNTKKDEEYRIYLSAENLDMSLSRQKEFREFFNKKFVLNTQSSINDFSSRIENDLKSLKQETLWFLDINKFKKKHPSIFASKRKIYLEALKNANDNEKIALGISYHKTYSRLSIAIHPHFGSHDYGAKENNCNVVINNISFLSIICMHIMDKAYDIMKIEDAGGIKKVLGNNFEKSEASKTMLNLRKEYEIGDIILTCWEDLAEIIEKNISQYGYIAYKVKFLSRPPIPEYIKDWLESQHILIKVVGKKGVRALFKKSQKSVSDPEIKKIMIEVLKQSDNILLESAKKVFADLHKSKILIPMLLESGSLKRSKKRQTYFE